MALLQVPRADALLESGLTHSQAGDQGDNPFGKFSNPSGRLSLADRAPVLSKNYVKPKSLGTLSRVWLQFFNAIVKRQNAVSAIAVIASPDAAAAPAAYSQAHIQSIVTELNELKTQFNALVAAQNV
jgi:hypothetical protein